MTLTIEQAYELPGRDDIRAMGFVIKLKELAAGSPEVKKLVDDYVVTPAVAADLPVVFEKMKQVFDRGEEYGRFIHGSFGSGKSHLMTMLSLLFEDVGEAWQKNHPTFAALRTKHHGWIEDAHLLVVRIHMLSVRGKGTGLDRAVYDGFNEALRRRGKAPFEFLHVDGVLDEARREAQQYGDVFWKNLANAGVVASKDDFEAMAGSKSLKQRESLARAYLAYKGRDAASGGIDPKWSEGLCRMAEHAKAQGFGGVVLLIDEFLLWLGEKSGQEFVEAINNLNVIVDHSTGQRAVPVFVFVARQKDIREFFPDLVDESKIHEQLDHHAQRFEKTMLQDIELRHIVKERVLRPKAKEAIAEATARLAQDHEKILPALLSNVDLAYLKDVYPFHPALIEALIDITALMQRERSALRLLYELLVIHNPTLPLGEFVPVGSAFDAIFPRGGVEASKKVEVLQDIHRQYYDRLVPAMKQMLAADALDDKRHHALDQMVKTVLLAEVSPRLKGKGLTIERLVQLNSVDVDGETYRGRLRLAATDLVALSNIVPDLQVTSTDKTAIVRYVLGGVSLAEVLQRARTKVDNDARRFEVFYASLKSALGIADKRGFGDRDDNVGDYEIAWRSTKRKGTLRIANVRELAYGDFEAPDGAFAILVDYPWDEPGQSVEADRQKAIQVRSNRGNKYTVCWLPRHMTPSEMAIVTDVAAVRFLQSSVGQDELLDTLSPADRGRLVDQAQGREKLLGEQLRDLLRKVYIEHGELFPLISDIDTKRPYPDDLEANLKHVAGLLMDRRYPHHPTFGIEPKKADLGRLLEWMVAAGDGVTSIGFDDETERVLRKIGDPLELVRMGQTKASLRLDTPYVKEVLQRADKDVVNWSEVADALREQYGFQPVILDLFLCFLCQRDHRALKTTGEPIEVTIGMAAASAVRLERGKLVAVAEWSRLRELAVHVLELPQPPSQKSLQQQDKLASAMREKGIARRQALEGVSRRLGHLGAEAGDRRTEIATAIERLAPLAASTTDSFKVLTGLLGKWPDKADDLLRPLVHDIDIVRAALNQVDDGARENLIKGKANPTVGPLATEHIGSLVSYLAAASAERPITAEWVASWNKRAQELIQQMITAPPPVPEPVRVQPPKPVPPAPERVIYNDVINVGAKSSVVGAVASIQAKLEAAPRGRVRVTITREDDSIVTGSAQTLLRKILEQAGGSAESGYVLVLDGEALADLPGQMVTPHGTYSVHRLASEVRLRHTLWKAQGAPVIAVIPPVLASKLPPDLFRRARNQRVHALAANDVLEAILQVRIIGADEPYLQQLAIENVDKLADALSRRTNPTVVDRRLFTELLVDVSVGEQVRALSPAALLASWVKAPPDWSENARKLVTHALPTLHGDEGRLLAWAVGTESSQERLRTLVVHGAILTIDADEVPKDAWGPLWDAAAHPPIVMDRRIVRHTLTRLVEGVLAHLGDAAGPLLLEAEDIGRRKLTPSLLSTSRVLPLAFHDRCHDLARRAANGAAIAADEIEWLRSHRAAPMGKAELLVLEAMGRLSRYLDNAVTVPAPIAEHVTRYQREGAFADLAALQLRRAMAGIGRYLAEAKQLLERYRARRNDDNRVFATVLAGGYEAALHHKDVVPLHRLWKRLVAPVWQEAPDARLYLVVLDGCSYPVFLDLLYDLAQHAAFPMGIQPDGAGSVVGLPALSPLPTITSHARGAIFLGELPQDTLVAETVFRDQQEAKTDKARLNQNAALGDRTRELFLKGDLADGGQRLLSVLRGDTQVVGAVFNAVDDQIGSSNTGALVRIAPESITAFRPSLEAALQAGRRVLVTADHGHSPYVDNSLRVAEGATPRFAPLGAGASVPEGFLEIDVGGLGGPPGRRAFAWKSGAYLGGPQVGFHGGCSLEEMVVPLAWIVAGGLQADEPAWWFGRGALPVVERVRRAPEPPTHTPVPTPEPQLDLFGGTTASALGIPDELLAKLTADERAFLALLKQNGTLKSSEVVARMKKPPSRVNGLIAQLQRKLHAASLELFITEKLPSGENLYRSTRVS